MIIFLRSNMYNNLTDMHRYVKVYISRKCIQRSIHLYLLLKYINAMALIILT